MRNSFDSYPGRYGEPTGLSVQVSRVMMRVYFKMFLALIVSGLTAWFCASSPAVISTFATLLFYLFAIVNGLMLFPIIFAYSGVSIAKTFFITAGVFGAMSVYGYFTNQDLSRFGSILVMCLIGLFIVILVNVFLKSSTLEWIISAVGVLIFIGLTAWDTQQVRRMAESMPGENTGKLATLGALTLYLDFINLFLFLLNFFGNSRN